MVALTSRQFERIAEIAMENWGLELTEKKRALVQNRLSTLLDKSDYKSAEQYLTHLQSEASEEDMLVFFDMLSTNTTSFFREPDHFDHLRDEVFPKFEASRKGTKVRIWSAACSIGCEPYTIALHAKRHLSNLKDLDFKILATDLSNSALDKARLGVYPAKMVDCLKPDLRAEFFEPRQIQNRRTIEPGYQIHHSIRAMVSIHQLNLMDKWPMKGPFDVIFLRNVMIYFNRDTRERLVRRMYDLLAPDGVFYIGSAESISGLNTKFRSVRSAVYTK